MNKTNKVLINFMEMCLLQNWEWDVYDVYDVYGSFDAEIRFQ